MPRNSSDDVAAVIQLSGRAIATIHRALFLDEPCENDEDGLEVWGDNAELYAQFTELMELLKIDPITHVEGNRFWEGCGCISE